MTGISLDTSRRLVERRVARIGRLYRQDRLNRIKALPVAFYSRTNSSNKAKYAGNKRQLLEKGRIKRSDQISVSVSDIS